MAALASARALKFSLRERSAEAGSVIASGGLCSMAGTGTNCGRAIGLGVTLGITLGITVGYGVTAGILVEAEASVGVEANAGDVATT